MNGTGNHKSTYKVSLQRQVEKNQELNSNAGKWNGEILEVGMET